MNDVDDLKKIQDDLRQEKIAEFDEVGFKDDCRHCITHPSNFSKGCTILRKAYCKTEVCHFYDKGDS